MKHTTLAGFSCWCPIAIAFILLSLPVPLRASPPFQSIAQHQIKGIVTDSSREPLGGVNIVISGKGQGTISDFDGTYTITAASQDTLTFSFIGFKTVEIPVNGQTTVDVQLQEDVTALGEVTVNAGYYTVSEKERTGSISRITSKDIEKQPVSNPLAAMQGQMTGVDIRQSTGVPGGGFSIQIRGQNSLRTEGNAPLYVIDGVPYSAEDMGSGLTGAVIPGVISPINSIDPTTIASIEVLKDADATAIYGSRGANGVVLITTKKGTAGKTQVTMGYSYGTGRVTRFTDLMNTSQYLEMRREAFANDGYTEYPYNAYDINGTWDATRYTDWQKVFMGGTSEYTDVRAALSGGSEQTRFLISGNFHHETTVNPGDFHYQKGNFHTNLNHHSKDQKFHINLSTGYTAQENNQPGTDVAQDALQLPPNAPELYNPDGRLNWENSTWTNPLSAYESKYTSYTYDLVGSMLVSYRLFKNLTLKTSLGFTDTRFKDQKTQPSTLYDPAYEVGSEYSSVYVNTTNRQSWIIEPQISWEQTFGDLQTKLLLGSTFQKQTETQLVQEGIGFSSNSLLDNLASAYQTGIYLDDKITYKYQAVFARANFSWIGRYILNLTGRRDGSSRFGPGRQFANFGAVGASWIFSKENFLSENRSISFGKLRASYGTSGNDQIGDYQYLDTYTTTGNNYGGVTGLDPTRLYNPDFGWETNVKLETALETGFLQDRIFFTAAWYRNRSSNQLVGIPLPATTGFSNLQANLHATVENRGWEFTLRTVNLQKQHLTWTTRLNLTLARNRLIAFPGLEGSTYQNQYVIGAPLNIKKVFQYTGMDPQTGIYQFRDFNGDGAVTREDDREAFRNLNPEYFGGLHNSLTYKEWQLDVFFQFVKQDNYTGAYNFGRPGSMSNKPVAALNRWQKPGDIANYQPYTTGVNRDIVQAFSRYYQSDAMIADASYIRLKNIALSYTLPKGLIPGVQCRITVQGQNLLTFTSYDGLDPESIYISRLPPLRVLTTGIEIRF